MLQFPPLPLFGTNWHKEMTKDEQKKLDTNTKTALKVHFGFDLTSEAGNEFVELGLNTEQLHSMSRWGS